MFSKNKKFKVGVLGLAAMTVSFAAAAMISRSTETEYTYFNADGEYIGSMTVPCEGRVIREGNTTDYAFFVVTSMSCDLAGPEPEPNQPPFPGPYG